ncbi:hypothetical protein L218DRAFT_1061868 [Marasmius fiardii PR-910]|nr:hypothetical protein L218DRAFT_1061868 [Marasmius fiardii PR-910]
MNVEQYRIVAKLQKSGWGEELGWRYESYGGEPLRDKLRRHKLVNQRTPFTDRIWTNIEPTLIKFLSSEKIKLLQFRRERSSIIRFVCLLEIFSEHASKLPRTLVMPPILYLTSTELFRTIIEDLPVEAGNNPSIFDDALTRLPVIIQEWNDTRTQIVVQALQGTQPGSNEDNLSLATSLFRCTNPKCQSREVYAYPAILFHSCYSSRLNSPSYLSDSMELRTYDWYWDCSDSASFEVFLHSAAVSSSQAICHTLELDAAHTTLDAMLKLNPVVECQGCTSARGSRKLMRWTSAVSL